MLRLRGALPYDDLLRRIRSGEAVLTLAGVAGPARGLVAAALATDLGRPVVVVQADLEGAREVQADAAMFLGSAGKCLLLPDRDLAPYEPGPVSPQLAGERLRALEALPELTGGVVVLTVPALHEALPPPSRLKAFELDLAVGARVDRERILHHLVSAGYRRADLVELAGEFSVRGAIVDVFGPAVPRPVRVELDGDAISSLRFFDPGSQRSLEPVERLRVGAAVEALLTAEERLSLLKRLPDPLSRRGAQRVARLRDRLETGASLEGEERYLPWLLPGYARVTDYLPGSAIAAVCEPKRLREVSDHLCARTGAIHEELARAREPLPRPDELHAPASEVWGSLGRLPQVHFRQFAAPGPGTCLDLPVRPVRYGAKEFGVFLKDLARWSEAEAMVIVGCESAEEEAAIAGRIRERQAEDPGVRPPLLVPGRFSSGAEMTSAGIVILPGRDVLGVPLRRAAARRAPQAFREVFADLKPGDPVVHEDYGIGLYRGVMALPIEGVRQDFFLLEYADQEKLYLPVDQVHRVQKYLGSGRAPQLSRLGTEAWERTKSRVKASLRLFAEGLLELYAARQVAAARAFPARPQVEEEFARSFPYEETADQVRVIEEVGRDMSASRPMDRLVCGDVGYGKTEVALRAAFRAAMEGAQVAVLVPTTILAQQHYQNFRQRMGPVRVEMLSRFRDPGERKRIMAEVERGKVDVLVGTHQLLAKSLKFRHLGLLVIDEEHRFGVKQKERLKELRRNVHVLTLTATPIPRTLNMGLSGLRDLSVIETPPPGRLSVVTHVHEENPTVAREAILREMGRGGQVFYLHNRVQGIAGCAERVRELVPEARLAVAHGQMGHRALERAMSGFASGKADVLVCTSIIGAGLDLPNANTLIVERAEMFGLADLYQLRGRVGRSVRQAYAYFFFGPRGTPTLDARRRLAAMLEFGELGSGFRLAVRDLEIRGAGNLLGPQQHGVLHAVGFDLYSRLLDSAVRELKGEVVSESVPPQLALGMDSYLPDSYVTDGRSKLEVYKRLAACATPQELAGFVAEITDRYGPPPREVRILVAAAELRQLATPLNIERILRKGTTATLVFRDRDGLMRMLQAGPPEGFRVSNLSLVCPVPADPEQMLGSLRRLFSTEVPSKAALSKTMLAKTMLAKTGGGVQGRDPRGPERDRRE